MSANRLDRFLGGPPGQVALRLLIVCFVVGFLLVSFNLAPDEVFREIVRLGQRLADAVASLGLGAFRSLALYLLYGAAIVLPIWLVIRIVTALRGR